MKRLSIPFRKLNTRGVAHHAMIAVLLITAFAGFGAYRVFSSSAASQKVVKESGCVPGKYKVQEGKSKGDCKVYNDKAKIKEDCAKYKLVFKNGACLQECVDGLVIQKGSCVKKAAPRDCAGLNRQAGTEGACGPCVQGFVDLTKDSGKDACIKQVTCSDSNTIYNPTTNSCVSKGQQAVQVKANCDVLGLTYDVATNACTKTCKANYKKAAGVCELVTSAAEVRAICIEQLRKYDEKTNKCSDDCKNGFRIVGSTCIEKDSPAEVRAKCAEQFLRYDDKKKQCADKCKAGFEKKNNKCQAKDGAKVMRQRCQAEHLQYDANANVCKPKQCLKGFQYNAKKNKCEIIAASTEQQKRVACAAAHRIYDAETNTCKAECKTGFSDLNTEDQEVTCEQDDMAREARARCIALYLQYDKETKTCKQTCRYGFILSEGVCVTNENYTGAVTQARCQALGRVWQKTYPVDEADDNTTGDAEAADDTQSPDTEDNAVSGICLETCLGGEGAKFVKNAVDTTSYCTGGDATVSVNPAISSKDCVDANQVYMYLIQACSPRCMTEYQLTDGKCVKIEAEVDEDGDGLPDDNGGENPVEGGCEAGAQATADGTCPEDIEQEPTPEAETVLVDTKMSQLTCERLGRQWDDSVTVLDAEGNQTDTVKGCLKNVCDREGVKIIIPKQGEPYCKGYVTKITKEKCSEFGRVWIPAVSACATSPTKKKAGTRVNGSDLCRKKNQVYVYLDGADVCMSKTRIERLQDIAKASSKPFTAIARFSEKQLCNIQPAKHWNGKKCVAEKKTKDVDRNPNPVQQPPVEDVSLPNDPTPSQTAKNNCAPYGGEVVGKCPDPSTDRAKCEGTLNRDYVNGTCTQKCLPSHVKGFTKYTYTKASGTYKNHGVYNYCTEKQSSFCNSSMCNPNQPTAAQIAEANCKRDGGIWRGGECLDRGGPVPGTEITASKCSDDAQSEWVGNNMAACSQALNARFIAVNYGKGGNQVWYAVDDLVYSEKYIGSYPNKIYARSDSKTKYEVCADRNFPLPHGCGELAEGRVINLCSEKISSFMMCEYDRVIVRKD